MRKLFLIFVVGVMSVFPSFVFAQSNNALSSMTVQLWPEYDQPSMLVITDFKLVTGVSLPVDLTFHIPDDANLIAVASLSTDGTYVNAVFSGPDPQGESQAFSVTIDQDATYRFEYYQPLVINGKQRSFTYIWDGEYAVQAFNLIVLEPLDVTSLSLDPVYKSVSEQNSGKYYDSGVMKLAQGDPFNETLQYEKSTKTLIAPPQGIEPVAPVNDKTPGRVSLNSMMPYIVGGLGLVVIIGAFVYFFQASRSAKKPRRRSHTPIESDENSETYCPQCGTRAKAGDRFCRVCGARLRQEE